MKTAIRALKTGSALAFLVLASILSTTGYAQTAGPYTSGYYYNLGGQLTGVVQPCVDGGCLATEYTYNSAGLVATVDEGALGGWPGSASPSTWSWSKINRVVSYTYDSMGRVSSKEVSSASGTPYKLTQYAYDSMSRLECVAIRMNPSVGTGTGACSLTTPQGADGPDRITYTTYSPYNNKPLVITRAYGTSNQENYASYTYNSDGLVSTITDANGNVTTLGYDGFDRLSETEFPSATSKGSSDPSDAEHYTYDADNNRLTRVTRDGQTIQYTYDALNRMTTKVAPGEQTVYYGYNLQNQRLYANFSSATGEGVSDTYDGFGDLTSETVDLSGTAETMAYQYDADGDRTEVTYPDGEYITYGYDGLDRLSQVLESGSTALAAYSYNGAGQLTEIARGGGVATTAFGYDGIDRLSTLSQTLATTADDVSFSYQYNPADQIVSETISNPAYYPLVNGTTQSYAANGLNEYSTVAGTSYSYDGRGNLTSDGSTTYTYDVENRLLSASGTYNATLAYDPLGRLYSVTSGSTTTTFVYDGDRIAAEYDASGTLVQRYVYGGSGDDPIVWYEGSGFGASNRQYLLANQQGSIIDVTDSNGNALAVNQYHPYGLGSSLNEGRFQFTGQAYIPEVGLYYYKARMYNPSLGRFMQTDPIGYTSDLDLYAYVGNDPVDGTDFSGECPSVAACLASLSARHLAAGVAYAANTTGTPAEGESVVSVIINRAMSGQAQFGCHGAASCTVSDVVHYQNGKQFAEINSKQFTHFMKGRHNAGAKNAKAAVAYVATHGPTTKGTFYVENPHGAPPKKGQVRGFGNVMPSKPSHVGGVYLYQVPHQVRSEGCVEHHWCH